VFVSDCRDEGLNISVPKGHVELYNQLVELERANKNGIWARIIKNNFAPLFEGRESFDYVVGNPPWINWEGLPPGYRSESGEVWSEYGLTGEIPLKKRQSSGKAKTDISILMTYVSCDAYLKHGGMLGFVITRTVFQSEIGGWHFRRFSLPKGDSLEVVQVDDLDRMKPFRGRAANVTATFILRKGLKTTYPVRYVRWETKVRGVGEEDQSLPEVQRDSKRLAWVAYPVRKEWQQSSWLVGPEKCVDILRGFIGSSPYAEFAREGINTRGANGVYFVDILQADPLIVRNRAYDGDQDRRVPVLERRVEIDYLYPLLRGRDVSRWCAAPESAIVLPHDPDNPAVPAPFESLGKRTQEFLQAFREKLESRKIFRNFDPTGKNWHGLYSVLGATFARYKVVWREMANGSVASVVGAQRVVPDGQPRVVIPDHKLMIVPAKTLKEAYYVAAVLNSTIAKYIVLSFAISTGISTHILEKIPIPMFNDKSPLHRKLALLSAECHRFARKHQAEKIRNNEALIDCAVAKLWHVGKEELETIQQTVMQVGDGDNAEEDVESTVELS
jgi:hypothetical protein